MEHSLLHIHFTFYIVNCVHSWLWLYCIYGIHKQFFFYEELSDSFFIPIRYREKYFYQQHHNLHHYHLNMIHWSSSIEKFKKTSMQQTNKNKRVTDCSVWNYVKKNPDFCSVPVHWNKLMICFLSFHIFYISTE